MRQRSSLPLIKATVLRQSQLSGIPRSGWKRPVSRCQVGRRWRRAQDRVDPEEEEIVDTVPHQGWQRPASAVLEKHSLDELQRHITERERALMLSQGGPMAGEPFSSFPTTRERRFDFQPFRFFLLRRLRLPLPLTARRCQCGRLLDVFGHHRAACATVGVLGRRGFALESAARRVCREAGEG